MTTTTTIPQAKQRLRDEAELALIAFLELGNRVTYVPKSRAPVCVPGYVTKLTPLGQILSAIKASA